MNAVAALILILIPGQRKGGAFDGRADRGRRPWTGQPRPVMLGKHR